MTAGRNAYRDANAGASTAPASSLAAFGLLVFEAAALTAGYRLAAGLQTEMRRVEPHLRALLDTSRTALADGSSQIGAVTLKIHRLLEECEATLRALSKPSA